MTAHSCKWHQHCYHSLVEILLSPKILIVFDSLPEKKWVSPNNIITNAQQKPKLSTVEHFKPLSA